MPGIILNDSGNFNCTFDDVINFLSFYSAEEIFRAIAFYSIKNYKTEKDSPDRTINMVSLSRLSLLALNPNYKSEKKLTDSDFIKINQMVNSLDNRYNLLTSTSSLREKEELLLKVSFNQFGLNSSQQYYKMVNNLLLFKKNNQCIDKDDKNLNDYFNEAYKFDYELFAIVVFLIYVYGYSNGFVEINENTTKLLNEQTKEVLNKVLNLYSKTFDEIKNLSNSSIKYTRTDNYLYKFNIFKDFPIIKIDDGKFIIPIIEFWLNKIADNIYFDLLEFFAVKEKSENPKNKNSYDNPFSKHFGLSLELLLEEFIKETNSEINFIPEFEDFDTDKKSPDLNICEGKKISLFQIKNKRAILKSQSGDFESYYQDVEKGIIYPHLQNYKLLSNVKFLNKIKERFEVNNIKTIYSISLNYEDFYIKEFGEIEKFIKKRLWEEKINNNINFEIKNINSSFFGIQRAIEITKNENTTLNNLFKEYLKYLEKPSIISAFGVGEFPYSLEDFLISKKDTICYQLVKRDLKDIQKEFNREDINISDLFKNLVYIKFYRKEDLLNKVNSALKQLNLNKDEKIRLIDLIFKHAEEGNNIIFGKFINYYWDEFMDKIEEILE